MKSRGDKKLKVALIILVCFGVSPVFAAKQLVSINPSPRTQMNTFDKWCTFAFANGRSARHFARQDQNVGMRHMTPDTDPLPFAEHWQDKIFIVLPGWGVGDGLINLQRAYFPLARALHPGKDSKGVDPKDVHIVGYNHSLPTGRIIRELKIRLSKLVKQYRSREDQRRFVMISHSLGTYVGMGALLTDGYYFTGDGTYVNRRDGELPDGAEAVELWQEFDDVLSIAGVSPYTGYDLNQLYYAQSASEFHFWSHAWWSKMFFGSPFSYINPSPHRNARNFRVPSEGTSKLERYRDRLQTLNIASLYSQEDGVLAPWIGAVVPEGYGLEVPKMNHIDAVLYYRYLYRLFEVAYGPDRAGATYYSIDDVRQLAIENGAQLPKPPHNQGNDD